MTPIDYGKNWLVSDNCQKITMREYLARAKALLKKTLIEAEVSAAGTPIALTTSTTGNGGIRYWFACPVCEKRSGVLYMHPITHQVACRSCLGLKYRSQRFKGMVEDI